MEKIDILLSVVMAFIVFSIGASVKFKDFRFIIEEKKSFLSGLGLQMVFLPALALLIAIFSDLSPVLKVGVFIISICPGGNMSNFISYLVNADVALSVSLTAVNSLLILLTIPALSSFGLNFFLGDTSTFSISLWSILRQILIILLIPAFLGVWFNEKFSIASRNIKQPLKIINTILLGIVFGIKYFADKDFGGSGIQFNEFLSILPYCLLLNLIGMLGSYFLARKININNIRAATIAIEVGLQNTALSLLVTSSFIGSDEMSKPSLVMAMFSFFTTLIFAFIVMQKKPRNIFLKMFKTR